MRQMDTGTPKKLILKIALAVFGIAVLILLVLVALVYSTFPRETHRLGKYAELRTAWDQEFVAHFPPEIPGDASLKKFSHFPGFLQGGAHIQLRLRLPPERIRKLYNEFVAQRTKSFFGGDGNRHMNEKEGMPTTSFQTGDTDGGSFPNDYEIMIFDRVLPDSERPPGFYWNHGRSHGVAISTNRNEIIYWAESW
jgi:hypothetical protein